MLRPPLDGLGGDPVTWRVADARPDTSLTAVLALLAVALILALVWWLRRAMRRRGDNVAAIEAFATGGDRLGAPSEADARVVRSGLAQALEILTAGPRSDNAVLRAWQRLERAAAEAGVDRRPAETAAEFTARILRRSTGSAQPIAVLLALYPRVRFGEHTPTAHEVAEAHTALSELVERWRRDLPERRASRVSR